jgi:tRNA-splicing ligase RtcB
MQVRENDVPRASKANGLRRATQQEMKKRGILVKAVSMSGLAEEAGLAYKNISEVVESVDRAGITKKVAELRPIGNIKG